MVSYYHRVYKPNFFIRRCEKIVNGTPANVAAPKDIPRRNLLAPKSSMYQNKKLSINPHIIPAMRKATK